MSNNLSNIFHKSAGILNNEVAKVVAASGIAGRSTFVSKREIKRLDPGIKTIRQARDIRQDKLKGEKANNSKTIIPVDSIHGQILQRAEEIKERALKRAKQGKRY